MPVPIAHTGSYAITTLSQLGTASVHHFRQQHREYLAELKLTIYSIRQFTYNNNSLLEKKISSEHLADKIQLRNPPTNLWFWESWLLDMASLFWEGSSPPTLKSLNLIGFCLSDCPLIRVREDFYI